ncbi:MAG: universal stress protein [Nitrososphaerales archaeon]
MSSTNTNTTFPLKKVLVAFDGSDNAGRALEAAKSLAKQNTAELIVVHVVSERPPAVYSPIGMNMPTTDYQAYFKQIEDQGNKLVNQAVEIAKAQGIRARGVVIATVSSTVESILDTCKNESADLIVVGTRGLGGFKKLLLGSVSSGVLSHASCSVLVVR